MQTWGWLLVYVAGFGLLQLLLYRHFGGRESTPVGGEQSGSSSSAVSVNAETGGVQCQHCGADNDAHRMVRYCRDCVEPLQ